MKRWWNLTYLDLCVVHTVGCVPGIVQGRSWALRETRLDQTDAIERSKDPFCEHMHMYVRL